MNTGPMAFMRGLTFPGGQQPIIKGGGVYLTQLSFERGSALLLAAAALIAPAFTRFLPPERAARLGEWVARLTLSYLCDPSERVQLDDPARAKAVVEALRADGVLVGRTGPLDDVLKIRPPLVFGEKHVAVLVAALDRALAATATAAARA